MKRNRKLEQARQRAQAAFEAGRLPEAHALYSQCCKTDPGDIQSWHMLSAINGMQGWLDEAERCCRRVLALQPGAHGALINLANVLTAQGRLGEAETAYRQVLAVAPKDEQALTNLGNLLLQQARANEAADLYRTILARNPGSAVAHSNLSAALLQLGDAAQAEDAAGQAAALAPGFADAHANLGNALMARMDYEGAETCYRRALDLEPGNPRALANFGRLLESLGRYREAMAIYERVQALQPTDVELLTTKAALHERLGEIDAARALLEPLVRRGPIAATTAVAYATTARRLGMQADAIEVLERAKQAPASTRDRADLYFALGDSYDQAGTYDLAMEHYRQANALAPRHFDLEPWSARVNALIRAFPADAADSPATATNESDLPVFIIGMPRSGTSLVEQILASHPQVFGGGEMDSIAAVTARLPAESGSELPFPDCMPALGNPDLDRLAEQYLAHLSALAPGAARITDKTPMHFLELGFIDRLLPGSRVIHCTRDPLDTCLSIYFHHFNELHDYASDLADLGHFYRLYRRLMAHWRAVLRIPMLEVRYEDVVEDQESMTRQILDFCGLEWDEACLRYHETSRVVNTPSYHQVRKPIYRASVQRWRHYEAHIEPLRAALGQLAEAAEDR